MTTSTERSAGSFSPGTVIRNRARLWRVDAQEGSFLVATSIDGGETEQTKFYIPFEDVQPGHLEQPSSAIVGHIQAQDLLLRAYRLSLLHGAAPPDQSPAQSCHSQGLPARAGGDGARDAARAHARRRRRGPGQDYRGGEELLPVAVPVYGGTPLPAEAARRLLGARPSADIRTEVEAREALADALSADRLEVLLTNAVEERRQELVAERRGMRKQMEQREGAQMAEWLGGIDDLSPGSFDLLTAAVLFPA